MANKIPMAGTDVVLHAKDSDLTEKVAFPVTRYNNVINSPKIVSGPESTKGAPFLLYEVETEELDTSEIRELINNLL